MRLRRRQSRAPRLRSSSRLLLHAVVGDYLVEISSLICVSVPVSFRLERPSIHLISTGISTQIQVNAFVVGGLVNLNVRVDSSLVICKCNTDQIRSRVERQIHRLRSCGRLFSLRLAHTLACARLSLIILVLQNRISVQIQNHAHFVEVLLQVLLLFSLRVVRRQALVKVARVALHRCQLFRRFRVHGV